jgi:hypothetical protein
MVEPAALHSYLLVDGVAVLTRAGLSVRLVAEVLQFYKEVMRAEDLTKNVERTLCILVSAGIHEPAHLAVPAPGQADEALSECAQGLERHQRRSLSLGVSQVGRGDDATQIGVAVAVLGQEDEVVRIGGTVDWCCFFVTIAVGR